MTAEEFVRSTGKAIEVYVAPYREGEVEVTIRNYYVDQSGYRMLAGWEHAPFGPDLYEVRAPNIEDAVAAMWHDTKQEK